MKPILILLLDRGYAPIKIKELTGFSLARIYYANKKYQEALPKLKEILNKAV